MNNSVTAGYFEDSMTRMPHRCRGLIAIGTIAALLGACSPQPESVPSRAGYEPGTPGMGDVISEPALPQEGPEEIDADQFLFAGVEAALKRGDWMDATLAMPQPADASEAPVTEDPLNEDPVTEASTDACLQLWMDFYNARIAWAKGDLTVHDALLKPLIRDASSGREMSQALRIALLEHRLNMASLSGDAASQVQLAHRLLAYPRATEGSPSPAEVILWHAAQQLSADEREALAREGEDLRGWVFLAAASQVRDPLKANAAISAWLAQYPEHSAAPRAQALLNAARVDASSEQVALLLPLSGQLAPAGDAVARGFIAAHYAEESPALRIDVIDSRRFSTVIEAYRAAQARGAQLVVGPLGKRQVAELLGSQDLSTPVLALNRVEEESSIPLNSESALQLSLSPEDEAKVLAERAYAAGHRRALLVRPEGVWGDRIEEAFWDRWQSLGASLPSRAVYGKPSTHSDSLRNALGLDTSAQRGAAVRALFNERVESVGRRRADLDAVILLAKSSEEARALKPMLNYHYAGDLDVFALSTADSGSNDANVNRDLDGVQLLAMPWRASEDLPPGITAGDDQGSFAALHALGIDAYRLAQQWWRMRSDAQPTYRGLTASLTPSSGDGQLHRDLPLSEFDRGILRTD
ncbi:MAG: hypothetical protein Cons2KO_23450 [Congregibacter sp.]